MKYIFISTAASKSVLEECEKKYAKHPMRFVQQWWDYSMATALKKKLGNDFYAVSFPPISTFPSGKCIYFGCKQVADESGLTIDFPSTLNLPLIKQWWQMRAIKKKLARFCRENKGEDIAIITHCIYLQSAKPAFKIRKKYGAKVYTIVPDLPDHATSVAFNDYGFLKKIYSTYASMSKKLNKEFDGYICFAEPQMEYLNKEKPHIVMEGFVDTSVIDAVTASESHPNRIIYAGGLMYRYGIRELVDGFVLANIPGSELYVYGKGEAEEYIKGKEDKGVYYGGCLSREEVIVKEKEAFILVNPRPTKDAYSRCSFPSKLMEYMASGTPVLTSRLGCIGEEYFDKLNFIDDVTPEEIAKALKLCFENRQEIIERAKLAANYIKEYKNADYQAGVVADFIANEGRNK